MVVKHFKFSKMAISVYKNDNFEEMGAWSQILERVPNSTIFYLTIDTQDWQPWGHLYIMEMGNL